MREISTTIDIAATPDEVWGVLADTAGYGRWNPFIPALTGRLVVGGRLSVRITPPGGRAMTFRPTVTAVQPGRRLAWLGSAGVRGIADGAHVFDLAPLADGTTRLTQSERFTGVAVPLLGGLLRKTLAGFEQMNSALKTETERRTAESVV
jgi:hypothetical protein